MQTYIIDWGDNCNGARYATISALDPSDLFWAIDSVGDPSECKYCNLTEWQFDDPDNLNYLELGTIEDCYTHSLESLAKEMPWKNITDLD